jgi:hypothetical protein
MAAMAKKKSQNKKHKFKYAEPTSSVISAGAPATQPNEAATTQPSRVIAPAGRPVRVVAALDTRDFSYVGQDLRRVGVMAGSLLALEVILWYLFGHSGLGSAVYNLIKV